MNKLNLKRILFSLKILTLICWLPGHVMAATETQVIDLDGFNKIHVLAPYKLEIVQDSDFVVEVTVDQRHADVIRVSKDNSTLFLSVESGNYNFSTLNARVSLPALTSIKIVGAARADLSGFSQQQLDVAIIGVGRVAGTSLWIDELDLAVIGTGGVDFGNAGPFQYAHVALNGVNESTLNMDVDATISGVLIGITKLNYWGTNVNLDVAKIGLSKIKRLGATSNNQGPPPTQSPTPIGVWHSGSWYHEEQSGHGFSIEIGSKPNGSPLAVVYWYIFDDFGNPVFLVGSGVPDGNVLAVNFEAPVGMVFGEFDSHSVVREAGGTGLFEFSDENSGVFSYTPSEFTASAWGHSRIDSLPLVKLFAIDFQ